VGHLPNRYFKRIDFVPESILPNFFFSVFFFFGVKLGHFNINNFFLYVTKMQAKAQFTREILAHNIAIKIYFISVNSVLLNNQGKL